MDKIIVEYVWVDANLCLRSKARTFPKKVTELSDISDWDYDGSSTGQADGNHSEIIIKPRCIFNCPFRGGDNVLVMCDCYNPDGSPAKGNNRCAANEIFNKDTTAEPWFGLEQEFFLFHNNTALGFNEDVKQGQFYCGVGAYNVFARDIIDSHYTACLYAGIEISGINAEVAPGQWEYQIGPSVGISAGDNLYMARYILERITERYDLVVVLNPKPLEGNWNGSGCHVNYSTEETRSGTEETRSGTEETRSGTEETRSGTEETRSGLDYINDYISKLSLKHSEHMEVYGNHNKKRLTGLHETANYDTFTHSVGGRGSSIRVNNKTFNNKCGYLEDRRPASNIDPYQVTSIIFETTVL
jgi:glutamine synthetase